MQLDLNLPAGLDALLMEAPWARKKAQPSSSAARSAMA
ncbi:hypothetical protein JYK04_01655 [Streptomyces nojiriensis]|nr:hypothetical protein JYK04_01655 [Streptomyces nojiriensis]